MRYDLLSERKKEIIDKRYKNALNQKYWNEALSRVQRIFPDCRYVDEEYVVVCEDGKIRYCNLSWDYPGEYYPMPINVHNDEEFINKIVNSTLSSCNGLR